MLDTKQLLRDTRDRVAPPSDVLGGLDRRRRNKGRVRRASAAVVAIAIALAGMGWWIAAGGNGEQPAVDRSRELGIFAPVAGRIVFENQGIDRGYGRGIWAVDPNGPSDTTEGPGVADDVASTLGAVRSRGRRTSRLVARRYRAVARAMGGRPGPDRHGVPLRPPCRWIRDSIEPRSHAIRGRHDLARRVAGRVRRRGQHGGVVRRRRRGRSAGCTPDPSSRGGRGAADLLARRVADRVPRRRRGVGGKRRRQRRARGPRRRGDRARGCPGPRVSCGRSAREGVGDHEGGGRPAIYTFAPTARTSRR
jgi:hypothetical protein